MCMSVLDNRRILPQARDLYSFDQFPELIIHKRNCGLIGMARGADLGLGHIRGLHPDMVVEPSGMRIERVGIGTRENRHIDLGVVLAIPVRPQHSKWVMRVGYRRHQAKWPLVI